MNSGALLSQPSPVNRLHDSRLDQQAIPLDESYVQTFLWDAFPEDHDPLNGHELDSYILHQDYHKRKNEQPNPVNVKKACYSKTDSI